MSSGRLGKKSGAPLGPCDPPEIVTILLSRLKDCELDESKKSLLCAELNDLLWYFEKHPGRIDMFRSDMLEWRTFMKQSKAYMEDMFESKMARTKQILDHLTGKIMQRKVVKKETPQPSYYQILFRPGIRSIRQYPINEEHYGEHNKNIDQLHKQIAKMREEIIYAPQTKLRSAGKKVMLDILLSIVEICAYDVLDGIGFVREMRDLVNSIAEGEEYREKTNIVGYMAALTSKLKEHAKCHWLQGNALKRRMWDDIASIEKDLELMDKPKFDLALLSKSDFLRLEKMKEIAETSKETPEQQIVGEKEADEEQEKTTTVKDVSCYSLSLCDTSSATIIPEHHLLEARGCENAGSRLVDRTLMEMKLPDHKIKEGVADGSRECFESSQNICSSQSKLAPRKLLPVETAASPVMDWANNIIATYGAGRPENAKDEVVEESKAAIYVPDAAVEEETIFKSKANPRSNYGLLKRVVIPPPPEKTDLDKRLIDIVRVELGDGNEERRDSLVPTQGLNPTLRRRRLLKY